MKNKIRFLVLWVGTKCTLKCRDCCNLIPYLDQKTYNVDNIINNINYITQDMEIELLQIQGGEPFTHKYISEIIEKCAINNHIHKIEIASNGTILPNEDTIKVIKKYSDKISIRFSGYNCTENIRKNVEQKLNMLYGIDVKEYKFMYDTGEWFELGGINSKKDIDNDVINRTYMKCPNKSCWTLAENYFAGCGRMIAYLQLKKENTNGNNIIDLAKIKNDGKNLLMNFKNLKNGITLEPLNYVDIVKYQII